MNPWKFEWRLLCQARLAAGAVLLLALLSALSVWSGMQAVAAQREAIARIGAGQRAELAALAHQYRAGGDAGYAAYQTAHLAVNAPPALAFAAIGQRDMQAFALRIRLLGLQSQLYESEAVNPEMVMAGRFDFAFVLVYLAPLLVIALLHDLVSGEREAGRLRLLASLPLAPGMLWRRRVLLRFGMVLLAALLPLCAGMLLSGVRAQDMLLVLGAAALYLGFWCALAALVAARAASSAAGAAILLACLVGLTMIVPTLASALIARAVPVSKGVEVALAQRQAVHQGWDVPQQRTFAKFFLTHPQWKDTAPVTGRFHWKWYYAMQQAGDDAVAPQVAEYRRSMLAREDWTACAGVLLASVDMQVILHRLAQSDLHGQLAWQDRVAAHHARLRRFYYPFIFNERPFGPAQFAQLPVYDGTAAPPGVPAGPLLALALMALGAGLAAARALGRTAP